MEPVNGNLLGKRIFPVIIKLKILIKLSTEISIYLYDGASLYFTNYVQGTCISFVIRKHLLILKDHFA